MALGMKMAVAMILLFMVEIIQFVTLSGVCDIDDILLLRESRSGRFTL